MDAQDFKKFSFVGVKSPSVWGAIVLIFAIGVLVGLFPKSVFEPKLLVGPVLFALGFIAVNLFSGFFIGKVVSGFKSKWAYYIALTNQITLVLAMLLFSLSSKITFFDTMVLWTAASYTTWMLILTGLGSLKISFRAMILSLFQAVLIWIFIILSTAASFGGIDLPLILIFAGIIVSTLVLIFNEHIFSLVFVGMSGMVELSNFLKGVRGEQVSLDLGYKIDALVQYIIFKTGKTKHALVAPWLHSGPIRSVGGGNLSTRCISLLNRKFDNSYVMHIPCSHEHNPSDSLSSKVVKSIEESDYSDLMVSDIITLKKDKFVIRGQKLNDVFLLSLSNEDVDDYDMTIFDSLREKFRDKKVMFIDSHPNPPLKECHNVMSFSSEARVIEKLAEDAIGALSKEQQFTAKVGTSIAFSKNYSAYSMVLKTKDKHYLYFLSDTNGLSENEAKMISNVSDKLRIDHTLFFTTDTHALSIKDLVDRQDIPQSIVEKIIKEALANIKAAKFSYGESILKNVKVLGETYYELTTLVKIMARVIPIFFVLLFFFLVILLWIF